MEGHNRAGTLADLHGRGSQATPAGSPTEIRLVALDAAARTNAAWLARELPRVRPDWTCRVEFRPSAPTDHPALNAERLLHAEHDVPSLPRCLLIIDRDLFVPGLNHVFGLALARRGRAVVALPRLRESFYNRPDEPQRSCERLLKESLHELGHTFGLGHCADRKCAMHFSNALEDTDSKLARFCQHCSNYLSRAA